MIKYPQNLIGAPPPQTGPIFYRPVFVYDIKYFSKQTYELISLVKIESPDMRGENFPFFALPSPVCPGWNAVTNILRILHRNRVYR
jgi:hypothetical protein